jgi:hypothetical protein
LRPESRHIGKDLAYISVKNGLFFGQRNENDGCLDRQLKIVNVSTHQSPPRLVLFLITFLFGTGFTHRTVSTMRVFCAS